VTFEIGASTSGSHRDGYRDNRLAPGADESHVGGPLPAKFHDTSSFQHYGNIVGGLPLDPALKIPVEAVIAIYVAVSADRHPTTAVQIIWDPFQAAPGQQRHGSLWAEEQR
jgi:hypothetical protein